MSIQEDPVMIKTGFVKLKNEMFSLKKLYGILNRYYGIQEN